MVTVNDITGIVLNIALFLMGLVLLSSITYLVARVVMYHKRFNHTCIILEQDGFGQANFTKDVAGIFVDQRTKNKRFFLKNNNVGLQPDDIPFIKGDKGNKVVFLVKQGLKNFNYITFDNIFDDKGEPTVGEEDVNWAINAYESQKKIFGESLLHKLIPYFGIIIMGVFIIVMIALVFQKITVISDASIALKEAAQALAQAKSGTSIIQ